MSVFGIESATLEIMSTGHPPGCFMTMCGLLEPEDALESRPVGIPFSNVTTYPMPIFIKKNSTSLKLQPPLLTNLKKENVFSFILDLRRHRYATVTSVA
jgi:hypothetical protein